MSSEAWVWPPRGGAASVAGYLRVGVAPSVEALTIHCFWRDTAQEPENDNSLPRRLPERCSQQFSRSGLLRKGHKAEVVQGDGCFHFQLHIFRETAPFVELPDFCNLLHNRDMRQVLAAVLTTENLRLDVIERNRNKNICIVFGS